MRDCDTGSSPVDPFRERAQEMEALKRECANKGMIGSQNAAKSLGGGEYMANTTGCEPVRDVTADDLLRDLESALNAGWHDIQALRQALPRRLSPAADRALCDLIRAARVRG